MTIEIFLLKIHLKIRIHCSISIGVAGFPLNADNKDQLIQKADVALYKAKDSGRNKVILCGIDD